MTSVNASDHEDHPREELPGYFLQHDLMSSVRLYFQHWMWQRQLGYLIHPNIPIGQDFKLADVACGTGIWLIDLARHHPHAQLDGFDISSSQFPNPAHLPKNIRLENLDLHKPIPEFLRGKYDVIHVGLLVLVVQHDNPLPVLDNLLSLLKPGGYLQWDEADFGNLQVESPHKEIPHKALEEVKQRVLGLCLSANGTKFSWVRELASVFEKRSVHVVDDTFLPISDDIALPWTLQHLMGTQEFIQNLPYESAKKWWSLYEEAAHEVQLGARMTMGMASVVGRKPL